MDMKKVLYVAFWVVFIGIIVWGRYDDFGYINVGGEIFLPFVYPIWKKLKEYTEV